MTLMVARSAIRESRCASVFSVFITAVPITKLFVLGEWDRGGRAMRDDEPRPVWTSLPTTH